MDAMTDFDFEDTVEHLQRVFGISAICPVVYVEDEGFEKLCQDVIAFLDSVYPDKTRPLRSTPEEPEKIIRRIP